MGKASGGIEADTADYRINTPQRSARTSKRCDQRASAAVDIWLSANMNQDGSRAPCTTGFLAHPALFT